MSGGFGWHGHKSTTTTTHPSVSVQKGGFFDSGAKPASVKIVGGAASRASKTAQTPKRTIQSVHRQLPIPDAMHDVQCTAEVAIIVVLDVTGSMGQWPEEIFRRLPLLYDEACEYFNTQSLEILFIAHGDARTDCYALQVARFAAGPELDEILSSFNRNCGGGGQATESHELVAYYLLKRADVTSARQVYTFFLTDEAACPRIAPNLLREQMDLDADGDLADTSDVFAALRKRMNVYTVLCETTYYDDGEVRNIQNFWQRIVGTENVLPLNDSRRVVDVMLGVFAKTTDQLERFSQKLSARQAGSQYAGQNIGTVMHSIALVGNGASKLVLPKGKGTLPLLPANPPLRKKK